ncbi:hypothetical protein MIND_00755100 [Mycena indigotica]|uniref:Peroxisome membrane anchor protein Pex14p N-terminal domain-containing protein n=1 Tax=Mycena indigotica TaxID=2126181 RepID=A0A8H6W3T5_9AGAR|nr:uncharacterized protein MIND_00755100 [Mycena indigotica]KAF7301891.1 hypothetical protein MIND_00755100 [Mycena indigotica]
MSSTVANPETPPAAEPSGDRTDLLTKARAFLQQPQVQREDDSAKRKFLADKGLTAEEIDTVINAMPKHRPIVPPPTYPQPPPSNLPVLLIGMARILSWLVGGVAALSLIYRRILLPRVIETFTARKRITAHHLSLMQKLHESLTTLKQAQADVTSVLPKPEPFRYNEPPELASCTSIDTLLQAAKTTGQSPEISKVDLVSLLRCGIADFAAGAVERNPNTTELFLLLEGKIPFLVSDEGRVYEERLWDTLSTCPVFVSLSHPVSESTPSPPTPDEDVQYWHYYQPEPSPPTELAQALDRLVAAVPKPSTERRSPMQHALQAMTDMTGYISANMYSQYAPMGSRIGSGATLGPAEEEVRKEIRTLKGLVLNRRTFLPTPQPH